MSTDHPEASTPKTWGDRVGSGLLFICGVLFFGCGILMAGTGFFHPSWELRKGGIGIAAFGILISFWAWKIMRSPNADLDRLSQNAPIEEQRHYWRRELRDILILISLWCVVTWAFGPDSLAYMIIGMSFVVFRLVKCARELAKLS